MADARDDPAAPPPPCSASPAALGAGTADACPRALASARRFVALSSTAIATGTQLSPVKPSMQ
jgi:hypothetical protein